MNKAASKIDVTDIGAFTFKRRTMRDELRIGVEYSVLTGGVHNPTPWLDFISNVFATLTVLTESAPDGWDIEAMDPLDAETYLKITAVYSALIAAEKQQASARKNTLVA